MGQLMKENEKLTAEQTETEKLNLAAFEQNHETFRALNHQMWQIPLISMTLTGGLWFGVSKVEGSALFQIALLLMATVGNAALFLVIQRLRYVMEQTLAWLKSRAEENFVSAEGDCWYNKPLVVRRSFQAMLAMASLTSLGLLVATGIQTDWSKVASSMTEPTASTYYDRHALDLADSYEGISAAAAHPELAKLLTDRFAGQTLDILDVGAGTGRDSAWLAAEGHRVVAVEPSNAMLKIAQQAHEGTSVQWVRDALPELKEVKDATQRFDVVVLSAVWMHVPTEEREAAVNSIASLLKPNGIVYVTLRLGPADPERAIYEISLDELRGLAAKHDFDLEYLETRPDLLGRKNISWQSVLLKL